MGKEASINRRLGVHASIAGGLHMALRRAKKLGCGTVQVFSHNPRSWKTGPLDAGDAALFMRVKDEFDLRPVFVHASYLINIASADEALRMRSTALLREEMARADAMGAEFVVLHPGSARDENGRQRAALSLREVLGVKVYRAGLLIENTSGKRGDIASSVVEVAMLMEMAGGLAGGVCVDTCHAFAAGYDLARMEGVEVLADEVERLIGAGMVKLVHLNDSKGAPGSGLDRHEHIGKGGIGLGGLERLLAHRVFSEAPVILETPKERDADDSVNLRRVRKMLDRTRAVSGT